MISLEQKEFESLVHKVISAMEEAGYDPMAQFTGYLQTGDETYITRSGNARAIIKELDTDDVAVYVEHIFKGKQGR